jgi:hypothetical protein
LFVVGLSGIDILLSLLYISVILLVLKSFVKKQKVQNYSIYLVPFIGFKMLCAVLFCLLHSYIYRGGDTFLYFAGGNYLLDQIAHQPTQIFTFLFNSADTFTNLIYTKHNILLGSFNDSPTLLQCQLTAMFSFVGGKQFMTTTILMSAVSGIGIWQLYKSICKLYPHLFKVFALCILFYPSMGIWGSGILKDTFTLTSVGLIFGGVYHLLNKKKSLPQIIAIAIGIFLCFKLKPYVLYTFLPAMLLLVQSSLTKKVNSQLFKIIVTPIIIFVITLGGFFFLQQVSEGAGKYSIENVQSVAEGFQSWHTYLAETRDQSGYTLGDVEFTALGVLKKAPEALFVTYFRPFPFIDTRNFATFFEAIQSFILFLITIFIILRVGPFKFVKKCFSIPEVRAFLVFAIFLGVTVGLTSYNFGALSRYKIPCLPFFTSALAIIYYTSKPQLNKRPN